MRTSLSLYLLTLISFVGQSHAQWFFIPTYTDITQAVSEHKTATYTLAGTAVCSAITTAIFKTDYNAVAYGDERFYWNWNNINTGDTTFEKEFLFGAGTSAYQVEGNCTNTDWHAWETEKGLTPSGQACDQWNTFKDDIALLKQMHIGMYRFSLAWDKIQPTADTFDQDAIEHYKEMCKELKKQNIKAHIGFHHYADPKWFADLGGFETEENIHYFVNFCAKVINEFKKDNIEVTLWSTFNSPSGYAFHKYHIGDFPPGIKNNKQLTLTVLKNMMEAHVKMYQTCKKINPNAQIGILKNIMQLDPWRPWHPMDKFACKIATDMTDNCIFSFFTTGRFIAKIPFEHAPFMANVEHTNMDACKSLDFIGLNYYSHSYIKNMQRFNHPYEIKTKNPNYTIYAEGLYRAISTITEQMVKPIEQKTNKHLPIYVTENGIANDNPHHRELFFKRYLYALSKAKQDGHDVRGYIFWSFMDNYEWGSYNKKYGLVHVDFDSTNLTRSVKQDAGTQYFLSKIIK
jgi:beta-glucosidase